MEAINLVNSSKTSKRRSLDYYPTPSEVTHALMLFLRLDAMTIWEPACGDGAMSKVLEAYGHNVVSTDIRYTGYGQGGIDFLKEYRNVDAIITNPPFALSEQFISHAVDQAHIVAMVFKSQYWHAAKRSKLFQTYLPAWVLALTWRPDFLQGERGGAPTMDVIWTVWLSHDIETKYRILGKPKEKF